MASKRTGGDSVWTEPRIIDLVFFWASGMSAKDIAAEFDCFADCQDSGRNAILGKIARLRETSANDRERTFWSRGQRTGGTMKVRKQKRPRAAGTRTVSASTTTVKTSKKSHELTADEKTSLIDSIVVPAVTVTDEEVAAAFRQRMLFGKASDDDLPSLSWSSSRSVGHHGDSQATVKCTQEVVGMMPCGQSVVGNTARCELHGGRRIIGVKITGEALKNPEPEKALAV